MFFWGFFFRKRFNWDQPLLALDEITNSYLLGMYEVCRKFLLERAEHRERLYEVEAPGGWTERRNIWLNIKLGRYTPGKNVTSPTVHCKTPAH